MLTYIPSSLPNMSLQHDMNALSHSFIYFEMKLRIVEWLESYLMYEHWRNPIVNNPTSKYTTYHNLYLDNLGIEDKAWPQVLIELDHKQPIVV